MDFRPPLCTVLLLLLLSSCQGTDAANTRAGQQDTPSENRFNFFDAEILQAVAYSNRGNVVVSPIGIKTLLGMILEGAGGRSADQIRTALRLPERQDAIRLLFLNYLTKLREPSSGIKMEMGSSVFMANNLVPSHQYTTHLMDYYARLVKTDFANAEIAARNINNWIYDITRGLIPKLVDPENLQPDTQALLTNAVYFKGKWKVPFEQEATKVKCFYTSPGVCHNTNMMDTLEFFKYSYIQELNADALELPYQGEKFSMLLLVPKEVDGIIQLQRDISHFPVHAIVNALETTEVLVSLPRFEINFSTDLVPNLQQLGIQEVFGPNSNLSGMFERNDNTVQVSKVFHKAKIIVNEAGSEAAAGTGALVIPLMGSTISKFRADRPFLFFIRDTVKGITLFAGRVSVPESAPATPQYQRPKPTTSIPSNAEESEGLYDIFTSTTPKQVVGSGQQIYRPPVRPISRPVSSPVRPSGTSTSTNEGTQYLFSNQNSSSLQGTHTQDLLFTNSGTQNKFSSPSNTQQSNTQSSFSSQEGSNQNFQYPQNKQQFSQPLGSFPQNAQPVQQQQTYSPALTQTQTYRRQEIYDQSNIQSQPQPILLSQNRHTNQNIGLQYSQNTDRQSSLRESSFPTFQSVREPQHYHPQNIQPFNTQFQPANQPSYSQPHIPGIIGAYSSNSREPQPVNSLQSHTSLRNEQVQGYETTSRQTHVQGGDQIVFQNQRTAHSSSN